MRTWILLALLVVVVIGLVMFMVGAGRKRAAQQLADAREEALRWYERLGGQVMILGGDLPAVKQALVDAGERYNAAGAQLERASTVRQYELARETALEGLAYARAARIALGLDPGPDLPPLVGARAAGQITVEREVDVRGHNYRASPRPDGQTPYYYPGGHVAGRRVPAGWYSEPWWKTAMVAGAWGIGSLLVFDALFSPAWSDPGYDAGYEAGFDAGSDGVDGFGDGSGDGGGEAGFGDAGGDFGGDF